MTNINENKDCKSVNFSDFASRLLNLANAGRERSKIIKYFMHSNDTWVILLNIAKSNYLNKSISISDSLIGTLFTKESGIAFIKKSSMDKSSYLEIVDDQFDHRKKNVYLKKEVKESFEKYCIKLSLCVDDPADSKKCVRVL